ncbi:sensor histidine kinase [Halonotius sp. GCM10025705]|uniref:sensor histidine kinase n=1 Tax=Halonotius sp. GCM10025705 TaxID=3252678 RepID=UPI003622A937
MPERQQRVQALYEIALTIGGKETLTETADAALAGYLRKLNCSVGGIFRATEDGYTPTATIPADPAGNALLSAGIDQLAELSSEAFPSHTEPTAGDHCYLFSLPDFGALVIGKQGGEIDTATRSALTPLNEKLAEACRNKLVERQLREQRNRFEAVFDAIPEPIADTVVEDGTEEIIASNAEFERTFGDTDETPGTAMVPEVTDSDTGESTQHSRPIDTDEGDHRITTETTCETVDGPGEFLFHGVPVAGDQADEYIHLYVDITDQKRREGELQRYERLVENLPIGVYRTTPGPDGEFKLVNQGLVDILEADSKAYFENRSVSEIYVDPDERAAFSDRLLAEGTVDNVELQFETAAGNQIWGEVSGIVTETDDGPVFELALQDITTRKERDQQLDVLNRVLRHNLRNALNVIDGNAAMLNAGLDDDELQSHVEGIERRVSNLEELSEKAVTVRSLFDQGRSTTTACDVQALLMRVAREFEDRHPGARVVVDAPEESLYVNADVRLKMALSELVNNAVVHNNRATPEVQLTTETVVRDGEPAVEIVITDNGPGIPKHERKAIESGEETPLQHGTGLGLWLVYWAMSLLGGDIHIDDAEPGTRIALRLPQVGGDVQSQSDSGTGVAVNSGD